MSDFSQLPQNLMAERVVLAAILSDCETNFAPVVGMIESHDFAVEKHRKIWASMREVFDSGKRVDFVTVSEELQRLGQLESIDGMAYLASLDEDLPSLYNIADYARIVKEKSVLRRAVITAQKFAESACLPGEHATELLAKAEQTLRDLSTEHAPLGTLESTRDIIADAGGVEAVLNPHREPGISTPWPSLNNILGGGFRPGQMVVVGARPAVGKTALATQIAQHVAPSNGAALYSLEMGKQEILSRLICGNAGVDSRRLRQGRVSMQERMRLNQWAHHVAELPLWIDDKTGTTVGSILTALRRLRARHSVGLVVVDYLQLMRAPGRAENRNQEVSQISRGLKLAAKEFGVPFVVLAQLNRDNEKLSRRPQLSDLRDSGSIEQDADTVLLLHRVPVQDGLPPTGETEVIVAKQRNGPVGKVILHFDGVHTRFEDRAQEEPHAA